MKKCTKCHTLKPLSDYYKSPKTICKTCHIAFATAYKKRNPDKVSTKEQFHAMYIKRRNRKRLIEPPKSRKNKGFKSIFTITKTNYDKLSKEQNGLCSICGQSEKVRKSRTNPKPKRLAVDHCHTTGQIRGLLCHACNSGLGHFRDDLDLLASAASYLINTKLYPPIKELFTPKGEAS
jgi:hypothetical protein